MRRNRIRAYCRRCQHDQVFERDELQHGVHLLISLLTGGLWLISWLAIYIGHVFRPWRCKHCGWHKPEARQSALRGAPFGGTLMPPDKAQAIPEKTPPPSTEAPAAPDQAPPPQE